MDEDKKVGVKGRGLDIRALSSVIDIWDRTLQTLADTPLITIFPTAVCVIKNAKASFASVHSKNFAMTGCILSASILLVSSSFIGLFEPSCPCTRRHNHQVSG